MEVRRAEVAAKAEAERLAREGKLTFGKYAPDWFARAVEPGLANAKHRHQWRRGLTELSKAIVDKPIADITRADVLQVLTPLWQSTPETARRLRARLERVFDAAMAEGVRPEGRNPAIWRGGLAHLLPKASKLANGHHGSMPWREVPAFMALLREREAIAALALQWIILTAVRASEGLGARWREIDREAQVWRIPAARMKGKRPHEVPLSRAALALLDKVRPLTGGIDDALIFPGNRLDSPLSLAALDNLRDRMNVCGVTTHGFRSSFRDWGAEATTWTRELLEHALAHLVGNDVERAYARSALLERRRPVMEAWGDFVDGHGSAEVIRLEERRGGQSLP